MIEHKQYANGFKYIEITNTYAHAKIALQGAHVFEYKAVDKPVLLWCSKKAYFEESKAIRGGIPLCFPWFGKHEENETFPQHGFARTALWKMIEEHEKEDGSTLVRLGLTYSKETLKVWAYKFNVILEVTIGSTLSLALHITNTDTKPFKISTALHTYLAVSHIDSIKVEGLENTKYYDALTESSAIQEGVLEVNKEIDRIYKTSAEQVILKDINLTTRLKSQGSNALVVWNPWKEKSITMADMSDDSYKTMMCLETANAREDARWIEPSHTHTLEVKYIQSKVK